MSQSCLKMDSTPTIHVFQIFKIMKRSQSCLKMDSTPTPLKLTIMKKIMVAILPKNGQYSDFTIKRFLFMKKTSQSCLKMDSTPTKDLFQRFAPSSSQSCLKMDSTPTQQEQKNLTTMKVAILPKNGQYSDVTKFEIICILLHVAILPKNGQYSDF